MIVGRGHVSVIEHVNVMVKFICNRGFTHELVRHRLVSYSQESTRFCNYGKDKFSGQITVIDQRWLIAEKLGVELLLDDAEPKTNDYIRLITSPECDHGQIVEFDVVQRPCVDAIDTWMTAMGRAEEAYLSLIGTGLPPEVARGVLPIDLKTEIVATANLREWSHIFEQRCSPAAHPNMRQLMIPLREQFREQLPEIYGEVGRA
jgi:thymidylate synthase (FAD)